MAKSEKLLQKRDDDDVIVIEKKTALKATRAAPPQVRVTPPQQSTVGLTLWPAKNKELVIAGGILMTQH